MSKHIVSIEWHRHSEESFIDGQYNRAHVWRFDGGFEMPASPSPSIVPVPFSNPEYVDPEEAFIASLSSCHMLFFLHFAAQQGILIERYLDNAIGTLAKVENGKLAITQVTLSPEVITQDNSEATQQILKDLHHKAHEACFLANSVNFEIIIKA